MPNAGNTRMYTSGCPKSQNRCCHSSGSAPASTVKKLAPKFRWNISSTSATVITGMENSSRNCTTSAIHVKIGIRMRLMPGARMFSAVTIRLIAPTWEATPVISRPRVQKSTAVGRRERHVAVRGVHEPAAVGGAAEDPRRVDEDAAEHEQPQAEGIQTGEGDVTGTDLQRHHVVREGSRHRHHEEEHHRRGVHREHLVVLVGRQDRAVGLRQLRPDEQGFEPADEEEHHGDDAVHDADLLVIDREGPRLPARGLHRPTEVAV